MKIKREELHEILEQHQKWLDSNGKKGKKADLKGADLSNSLLYKANLVSANLENCNLKTSSLKWANLERANLEGAILEDCELWETKFTRANLKGANLNDSVIHYADLREANLEQASLNKSTLEYARLDRANLVNAKLIRTYFGYASLKAADLKGANLNKANFMNATLEGTNLSGANLKEANLAVATIRDSQLDNAEFSESTFIFTAILNSDLSNAKGLENVIHKGPSSIGIDTILKSKGNIPTSFLIGCGYPKDFIDNILPLEKHGVDDFYSCFICFSSKDAPFPEKLKNDLKSSGIRCWFFPNDATWGKDVYKNIDDAITAFDKIIVICSKNSLNSEPVLREIERAIQKEKELREKHTKTKRVLFPITIDDYVYKDWNHYLKPDVRRITIGDFRKHEDTDEYNRALDKLKKDLRKDGHPP